MAEQLPGSQPSNYKQPQLSEESVRSRLNSINSYLNAYRPEIISGITQAQQDQAELIDRVKSPNATGTPTLPRVQGLVSGNAMTGPNPGLRPFNVPDINYATALIDKSKIDAANTTDPFKYARPTAFNASSQGHNFERYYSHGQFKNLGFSVYRDNEKIYNANSSWLDDFNRMRSKWLGLAYQGASGTFRNWGKFGAFGEAQDAAQMANDISVAMSSKGGAGAWTTNFLANSAYSIGVMGEIVLEEAALFAATALTGGAASPLASLRTGQNVAKLGRSMKIMAETLSKADKAKTFWTAAKSGGISAAKGILPFTDAIDIGKQALNPNSAFNRLSDFAKMQKSFGAFYRGMREINAVTAESRLEAGFAQNQVTTEALNAFYKKNKRSPTTEEALVIANKGSQAATGTFFRNIGGIYLSNKIVLDTALRGFAPVRRLMSKEGLKSNMYKLVKNYGWKEAGTKPMEVVAKGLFSSGKKMISKDYLRSVPSRLTGSFSKKAIGKTVGGGLRYFSANLMEGLQESYQEAIQAGVTDYYLTEYLSELYSDPYLAENNSMGASIMKGIGEQFSAQGLDTFAQGFLMGGVLGGAQKIIMPGAQRLSMKTKDWYSKTNSYEEYQKSEKERLQKYADAYNDYSENPYKYVNWLDENVVLQRDLADKYQAAEETGDRKEAESAKDDSMFNHITTLLQTERYDSFIDQLTDLNELSDDDLADAFNSTGITNDQNKKSPRERLETAIKKSKEIKQRWEKVNEKFENPYNPSYFDKEKDKEAYDLELTGYQSFEIAKRAIAFNEYTFDRTISRLNSLVNNAAANGPLGNVAATDFSALYSNPQSFERYVKVLSDEIEALNLGDGPQKTLAKKKSTQLDNLNALKDLMDEYTKKLLLVEKAKQAVANPETASEESKKALEELNIAAKTFKKDLYGEDVIDDIAPDVIIDEFFKDKLYAKYAKYTKNIAGLNNVFPIIESIENSFADLVDYIKLDADAKHMSEFADMLANPMSIYQMARRVQTSLSTVNAKRKELHLKGLQTFKRDILDVDELFQKMLDMGVYFDPEHIDAFKKDGTLPPNFIDAMTGEAIKKTDPKYNQVVALIEQEEKLRGVTFSNKPVQYTKPEEKKAETETPAETPEEEVDDFEEAVMYDITTEFNTFPDDIKNKLKEAHAAAMLDGATTDIQEWMLEDPDAALIISGKTPAVKKTEKTDTEETEDKELDLITAENPKSFKGAPAEFKEQFDELEKQKWNLAPDKKTYISEKGDSSKRVSDLKEGEIPNTDATQAAIDRGNFLDEIIRSFATPEANNLSFKDQIINAKKIGKTDSEVKMYIANYLRGLSGTYIKKYKLKIGDSGVTEYKLQIDDGYFESMADVLLTLAIRYKDFNWYTSVPTMIGTLMGETFGGTIDLMLEKNGKYTIIDLKTSNKPRVINKELYDRNDQIQQNAYAELWEQITGKPISRIRILNLITTMTGPTSRRLNEVKIYGFKDSSNRDAILTPIPRVSIAELKGYTPEGTETPTESTPTTDAIAEIERRRQEGLIIPNTNVSLYDSVKKLEDGIKDITNKIEELEKEGKGTVANQRTGVTSLSGLATDRKRLNDIREKELAKINEINAKYDAELVAEYRKQEQAELAKAIPNMAKDYPDTYGDKQGKMPDDLYAIYKPIYDKYDKLIRGVDKTAPAKDTKTDIDLISTPVSKIVGELSKLNTLNEKLNWLKDNNLLSPININGKKYNTIDYSDRVMVLMKVGKYNIPFYISTGQAGKKTVKAGNWYAVFGIGVERGWINKGTEEQINNSYGFPLFEKLSKILNEGIGTIQSREDNGNGKLKEGIGFLSDSEQDLEAFNNNMNLPTKPAGKNTDSEDFYAHVNSTLSLLNNELKELTASQGAQPETKVTIPQLTTVRIDLAPLSIEELKNVAKQLREKAINARQAEKEGKTVLGGSQMIENDYQAVKEYIAALEGKTTPKPDAKKVDVNALRADLEDKLRKLDQLELVSELNEDPYSNPIPNIYILNNLPRITPESARKETGTKVGTVKDINPSLLSKSGVSVRKAAEIIVEQGRTEEVYLEEDYVLNEILDILQLGKNEYRKRNGKVNKEEIAQLKAEIDELSAMLDAELAKTSTKLTVKELKDSLVRRLQAGETITGTISKPTGTPNNVFEFIEEGKPTVTFYNTGVAQITMDDLNKTATLRLVEKIVTEDKRQYYNVVEVYIGDKLIGNVQTTDFKANNLTNNIIMAATPGDLMNNFSSYIANKTIRSKFKYKAKDDTEQIYTFDEVIDLTKRTLSNMKITPEEKAVYLKGIDDLVNAELGMVEKKVSPEEKESAQNVIDDAADKVVDIDGASVNEAIDQTQQEVDDEFDNSLGCK